MSKVIRDNLCFIQLLIKSPSTKQLKDLLRNITNDQLKALCEISVNVLYGNIPLSKKTKEQLKPYKTLLSYLSDNKKSRKRKLLQLHTKLPALQLLLKAVLPFLQSML